MTRIQSTVACIFQRWQ